MEAAPTQTASPGTHARTRGHRLPVVPIAVTAVAAMVVGVGYLAFLQVTPAVGLQPDGSGATNLALGDPSSPFYIAQVPLLEDLQGKNAPPVSDCGLMLYLTLDKQEFALEEEAWTTLTFVNTGSSSLELTLYGTDSEWTYDLRDDQGRRCGVWLGNGNIDPLRGRARPSTTVGPGQTYAQVGAMSGNDWTKASPEVRPPSDGTSATLWRPGNYTLTVTCRALKPAGSVRSNTVSFRVLSLEEMPQADRAAYELLDQNRQQGRHLVGAADECMVSLAEVLDRYPTSAYAIECARMHLRWMRRDPGRSVDMPTEVEQTIRQYAQTRAAQAAIGELVTYYSHIGDHEAEATACRRIADEPAFPKVCRDTYRWRLRALEAEMAGGE